MNEGGTTLPDTAQTEGRSAGPDVFVTARGIAFGVFGGAIVWALVLAVGLVTG